MLSFRDNAKDYSTEDDSDKDESGESDSPEDGNAANDGEHMMSIPRDYNSSQIFR